MTIIGYLVLGLLFVAGPLSPRDAASVREGKDITDTVKETFKVRPGGTLYLELDYGNIEVVTSSGDRVVVELERTVRVNDEDEARELLERYHEYSIEQDGGDVTVVSKYQGRGSRWGGNNKNNLKIRVKVEVPFDYNVDFESGAGNVAVTRLEGDVSGKTGAGNIDMERVMGAVDITTGAGNINIEGGSSQVEVNTGAGNVELRDVEGSVRANTGAGNITAYIVRQPEDDSRLETGAGNVTVYLDNGAGVYVDAVASMGSASCDFSLEVKGKWMTKSFEGEINGGGPDLFMRAGVGNVSLRRR
ncbi:MAG: DUF4097 family beta strand repeat-containing protein [Rhodothermales bacterium]